jgi:glycosyltransferase involved in cell wall biosynthesis
LKPRPVLHIIDTGGPGGAETVFLELVCGLDRDQWDPIVVVPKQDWLWGALEDRGIEPVLLGGTRSFDLVYLLRLHALARARRVEIIQTHLLGSAVYGAVLGRLMGIPQVSTLHGQVDVSADDRYLNAKLRLLDRASARLVFVSRSLRAFFQTIRVTRAAPLEVIHNGIDLGTFRPGEETALRDEFGVAEGEILLGSVGNVRPAKDYGNLLRALAELSRRGRTGRCVIVGESSGRLAQDLRLLAADLGLEGLVEFIGFRSDIERVMRALDVLIISSSSEGFSLTAVQALASGTAVVSTRCGGPEEILDDGVSGLLVPSGSPSALADGIERVCLDPDLRERLGASGRTVAEARFSLGNMIAEYSRLYRDVLIEAGRLGA